MLLPGMFSCFVYKTHKTILSVFMIDVFYVFYDRLHNIDKTIGRLQYDWVIRRSFAIVQSNTQYYPISSIMLPITIELNYIYIGHGYVLY